MASDTEICNLALTHIGVGAEIANLATDKGQEAQACRRVYDTCLKKALRDFEWPFASKVLALALVTADPTSEWSFSYQYPTDCLHFRKILSGKRNDSRQSRIPYKFSYGDSGQVIFTDKSNAEGEYTVYVSDPARFPPDFQMALSLLIGAYISPRLTKGDPFKVGDRCLKLYEYEISRAKATAVNEEQGEEEPDSEFIRGRN
jgi:hypothetical protein